MIGKVQFGKRPDDREELDLRKAAETGAEADAGLDQALKDFRLSVHAWSETAYNRPRPADVSIRRRSWRLAAGWALGCALVAGGISGGIFEHQRQQAAAHAAAAAAGQQAAPQQQVAAAQVQPRPREGRQDPNLMAKVDSDTAQEVPDAMEPLAQLMENGGNQ
jgi:hypothetical protein